jgi:tripartite-type tricarboxylate transporter receptor subunit TctC
MKRSNFSRRDIVRNLFVGTALYAASNVIWGKVGESYPNKPVTLLAPFPPGGVTDVMMRKISERFLKLTGQPMIIINKPGRTNALAQLASSPADGYTLSMTGRSQLINHWMVGKNIPYKAVDDFTWITTIVTSYFGIYVNSSSDIKNINDLIDAAKKNPEKVSYGTSFGIGGLTHAPMSEFERINNINMTHIPYKGDGECIRAVMSNEVTAVIAAGTAAPLVDAGKLRLLAWISKEKHPAYPNIKTLQELGFPVEAYSIVGIGGPKGMSPEIIGRIEYIFRTIIEEKEMSEYLFSILQKPTIINSDDFTKWAHDQLPKERESLIGFGLISRD